MKTKRENTRGRGRERERKGAMSYHSSIVERLNTPIGNDRMNEYEIANIENTRRRREKEKTREREKDTKSYISEGKLLSMTCPSMTRILETFVYFV